MNPTYCHWNRFYETGDHPWPLQQPSSDCPTSSYSPCCCYLKKKHQHSAFWRPDRHNLAWCSPAGYWSCSRPPKIPLKPHCSILRFLPVPPIPPRRHDGPGCFLPLPPCSHPHVDGEAGEVVTAFIVISMVDDLTWGFSFLRAALKLTGIWGVCPFGKPGWPWPASLKDVWGISL